MSFAKPDGSPVEVPRTGEFLHSVVAPWAARVRPRWKRFAAFELAVRGWSLEQIGMVLGHPKGHVSRMVNRFGREMRAELERINSGVPADQLAIP